jgi:hypothetical protein
MFALLRSFLAQYRFEFLNFKHDQSKITKTSPLERERTLDIRQQHWGGLSVSCFIFLIRMLRTLYAFRSLRVCFACGEVIMIETSAFEWWQQDQSKLSAVWRCSSTSKEVLLWPFV